MFSTMKQTLRWVALDNETAVRVDLIEAMEQEGEITGDNG